MDRMILIDGNNLLFRMFFGMPNRIYSNGILVHGVVGFIGSILKFIKNYTPNYIVVIFDSEIPSQRFMNDDYKKNRIMNYSNVADEQNPYTQLNYIKECLEYMNISYIEKEMHEADDVIATICTKYVDTMNEIIIISTDKDYFQLVNDKVNVLIPNGKKSIVYNVETIKDKIGILPQQYILYAALVGDKSDNISGIPGIGKVTACNLIEQYHNLYGIHNNLPNLKSNVRKKLEGQFGRITNNVSLITMNNNVNIDVNLHNCYINHLGYKNMKTMEIIREVI